MTYLELAQQLDKINKKDDACKIHQMTDVNRGERLLLSCLVSHDGEATPVALIEELHVSTAHIAALSNKWNISFHPYYSFLNNSSGKTLYWYRPDRRPLFVYFL